MTTEQCDLLEKWESTISQYCINGVSDEKKVLIATCLDNVQNLKANQQIDGPRHHQHQSRHCCKRKPTCMTCMRAKLGN